MTDDRRGPGNAFLETLLGLEYTGDRADLFSQACVGQFEASDPTRYEYLFAQVFEPDVLKEVAVLAGLPYPEVAGLVHRPTAAVAGLAERRAAAADLSVVELVNLAAALISISRFDVADEVLDIAARGAADPGDRFEVEMLRFTVTNRRDDGTGSPHAFRAMRAAIGEGGVPADRIMDACSQAVVWYLKRKEVAEDDFPWFLATGRRLVARPDRLDPGSLSAWYRAIAMIPAARGEPVKTRLFMRYAREAAEETIKRRPRAYEMHFLKTYHESSLKEHMYVTRDLAAAEEAGRALIDLDPWWAPSYGELAEAYARFGRHEQAADLYERAVRTGPPYVAHHLVRAARQRERIGQDEQAAAHHRSLAELVPDGAALVAGSAAGAPDEGTSGR